jgi:hypothetical protein
MTKRSLRLLIGVPIVVLLLTAAILLLYPILHYSRISWPDIQDYDRLFSEATILAGQNEPGHINNDQWTQSIRSISPRFVQVDSDRVEIIISTGGINPGWGFYIFTESNFELQPVQNPNLIPTVHPRIFRCTAIE